MKKIILGLCLSALAAVAFAWTPAPVDCTDLEDGHPLCRGTRAFFNFEEAADSNRWSIFGNVVLVEPDGVDLARATDVVHANLGTYSIDFSGVAGNHIEAPNYLGGQTWSVAFWLKADDAASADTTHQVLIGNDHHELGDPEWQRGTAIYLKDGGSTWSVSLYASDLNDPETFITADHATTVAQSTWTSVVVTSSPYRVGKGTHCISVNSGAFTCSGSNAYYAGSGGPFVTIGGPDTEQTSYKNFDGKIDGVLFSSRVWTIHDSEAYYNSGSGVAPPFS